MGYILLRCKECGEEGDIYCDGDNAMRCPECGTVDEFEEVDEVEEALHQSELYNEPL